MFKLESSPYRSLGGMGPHKKRAGEYLNFLILTSYLNLYFIMNVNYTNIKVGELGVFDLVLPKIFIRGPQKGPKVVLIATQHGNETTSIAILQQLLSRLKTINLTRGEITILPVANPLGLLFNSRREPLDGEDLNRLAPGNFSNNLAARQAAGIFQEVKTADLVIDLHNFNRLAPFMGVVAKGFGPIPKKTYDALKVIQPDCIWEIDITRADDKGQLGALDLVLTQMKIPSFALETKPLSICSRPDLTRIVNSLLKLLVWEKIISLKISTNQKKTIPIFNCRNLYSDFGGLFIPTISPIKVVKANEVLGTITNVNSLKKIFLKNLTTDTLLTINNSGFVRAGSKLASFGTKIKEI